MLRLAIIIAIVAFDSCSQCKATKTKQDLLKDVPGKEFHGKIHDLPNFHSANRWPICASTINFIKDQADCGSCYAVAVAEMASDRTCIANQEYLKNVIAPDSNGDKPLVSFSADQLLSCNFFSFWFGHSGCGGGDPRSALEYWRDNGLVTGGWYGSRCGCQPYPYKPCGMECIRNVLNMKPHHTPCKDTCQKGHPVSFENDRHYALMFRNFTGERAMMEEIATGGPIVCIMGVYENLFDYKSGIYDREGGSHVYGHVIKVVGWGTDPLTGEKYWILNNMWNKTWGMDGSVWLKRGINLAGIESGCFAGYAKKSEKDFALKCY